jgi:hypothetical protein
VLASAPHPAGPTNTDANYSPLWQVSLVTWNPGRQGRVLTSQNDVTDAASERFGPSVCPSDATNGVEAILKPEAQSRLLVEE